MSAISFQRPALRDAVTVVGTSDGLELVALDGRRFLELEIEALRREPAESFFRRLASDGIATEELAAAFPGSAEELEELLRALDEQGMLCEADKSVPTTGMTGRAAYGHLRRYADEVRQGLASPLYQALVDGDAVQEHLVGYAVEYWHITHLCPRAIAPVLARDDVKPQTWQKLMNFYQSERNHDRMLEKSLGHVGITREQLLRTQPLPATAAIMASLGVYAYQFPVGLMATLFPMEEPELEFLGLFCERAREMGMPEGFLAPIVSHSEVNDDEAHDAVSLDLLEDVDWISLEEVRESAKAVADILEQRARLDAELVAWYPQGGLRDFSERAYPAEAGRGVTCVLATSWA